MQKSLNLHLTPIRPLLSYIKTLRGIKRGNKLSRAIRHMFELSRIKSFIGANIAVIALAFTFIPAQATTINIEPEISIIETNEVIIKTEKNISYPVKNIVISQGYHLFHLGLDLDGVTGDAIYPILPGKVIKTQYSRFSYGNAVVIDHTNGYTSLYAHLSNIDVNEGDIVDKNTVIGEIGATGRAYGDHLHLEIYKDSAPLNPLSILPNISYLR